MGEPVVKLAVVLLALMLSGCVPVKNGGTQPQPSPVRPSDDVWDALARRIDSKRIKTTGEALLILRELVQSGDLQGSEAAKVDALGWEKSRELTAADADKLRGL